MKPVEQHMLRRGKDRRIRADPQGERKMATAIKPRALAQILNA